MLKSLKPAFLILIVLSIVTGIAYPLFVTAAAQLLFPRQANGSLIERDGKTIGSELIGQTFADPKHFWSRPSSTTPYTYNAASSSGSNLGPTNTALTDEITARIKALKEADPSNNLAVPVDLVTASASGLDPHISPAAAKYQISRIAQARHLSPARVRALVEKYTESRQFGFLGEPRVNVLQLNLALDALK